VTRPAETYTSGWQGMPTGANGDYLVRVIVFIRRHHGRSGGCRQLHLQFSRRDQLRTDRKHPDMVSIESESRYPNCRLDLLTAPHLAAPKREQANFAWGESLLEPRPESAVARFANLRSSSTLPR